MAKKGFSSFHRKAVSSQDTLESIELVSSANCLESVTYQDISAFPETFAVEINFRLSILRFLARKCETIVAVVA